MKKYGAYRDSHVDWLGKIPRHWDTVPLFRLLRGRCVRNAGNRVRDVLSLSYGRIVRRDVDSNFGLLPESFETYQIVEPGNIVLRLTDLQNDRQSLRVGHVRERGIITSAYVALEITKGVDSRFAYYLLNAYDRLKVFYGMGAGVRQTMKYEDLKRVPCVLPPAQEQQRIAAFLDEETTKIDSLIARQEELVLRIEERRTAAISRSVTQGMPPMAEMTDSGTEWLGQIPSHWRVTRLKRCTRHIVDCLHATPNYVQDGAFPAIRTADVSKGRLDLGGAKRVDRAEYNERIQRLEPQAFDIVYSREGERFGHAALVPPGVSLCISQRMMHFRASEDVDPSFLMWALNSEGTYRQASLDSIGSTAPHVNVETIRNFVLAAPPREEGARIAAQIESELGQMTAIDARIALLIERLRERRTALIAAAVTGQIEVKEGACAKD